MKKFKQYESDLGFLEFLNREFDKTVVNATVEEMAGFAFGGIEEAIKAFKKRKVRES